MQNVERTTGWPLHFDPTSGHTASRFCFKPCLNNTTLHGCQVHIRPITLTRMLYHICLVLTVVISRLYTTAMLNVQKINQFKEKTDGSGSRFGICGRSVRAERAWARCKWTPQLAVSVRLNKRWRWTNMCSATSPSSRYNVFMNLLLKICDQTNSQDFA